MNTIPFSPTRINVEYVSNYTKMSPLDIDTKLNEVTWLTLMFIAIEFKDVENNHPVYINAPTRAFINYIQK